MKAYLVAYEFEGKMVRAELLPAFKSIRIAKRELAQYREDFPEDKRDFKIFVAKQWEEVKEK